MAHLWICLHIIAHCPVLQSWWQYDEVCSQVCPEDTSCVSIVPQIEALWSRMGGIRGEQPWKVTGVLIPVQESSSSLVLERGPLPSLNTTRLVPSPWQNEGLDYADVFGNACSCSKTMECHLLWKVFSKSVQKPMVQNNSPEKKIPWRFPTFQSRKRYKKFSPSPSLTINFCGSLQIYSTDIRLMGSYLGRWSFLPEKGEHSASISSKTGD